MGVQLRQLCEAAIHHLQPENVAIVDFAAWFKGKAGDRKELGLGAEIEHG